MNAVLILAAVITNFTGIVTFEREGLPFFFMREDGGAAWRVERRDGKAHGVEKGEWVDVAGKREVSVKHRLIADEIKRSQGENADLQVPPPRKAAIAEIFNEVLPYGKTSWYGETLVTEGLLRDINRRQGSTQLLIGEGECNIQVEVPVPIENSLPAEWVLGATMRVEGVLVYTTIEDYDEETFLRAENIELIPHDIAALEVVHRAPFWNVRRLLMLLASLASLFAAVSIWAAALKHVVAKKTKELEESIRERTRQQIEADVARRERLRLAADLHDGFQQYLAGAAFRLKAAMNYLPPDAVESRKQLESVRTALQRTQSGLRATLWAMNEESEGPESLLELFRFVANRLAHWEGKVSFTSSGEERKVARNFAGTLLLILQESVGNALKHGNARNVSVNLKFGVESLEMTVADDGCGFDVGEAKGAGHFGIAGMERRTSDLNGEMRIESEKGKGTRLVFSFPV